MKKKKCMVLQVQAGILVPGIYASISGTAYQVTNWLPAACCTYMLGIKDQWRTTRGNKTEENRRCHFAILALYVSIFCFPIPIPGTRYILYQVPGTWHVFCTSGVLLSVYSSSSNIHS